MPRYFFHIRHGERLIVDEEGTELLDVHTAEIEAIRTAHGMRRDAERGGPSVAGQSIVVVDEVGTSIAVIPIALSLI